MGYGGLRNIRVTLIGGYLRYIAEEELRTPRRDVFVSFFCRHCTGHLLGALVSQKKTTHSSWSASRNI
uniref:Uncharacterized protein n=1 Tax=Lutzomyia longipalpis TaxID=7200 RepID=A0A1B0CA06_LUTLO